MKTEREVKEMRKRCKEGEEEREEKRCINHYIQLPLTST